MAYSIHDKSGAEHTIRSAADFHPDDLKRLQQWVRQRPGGDPNNLEHIMNVVNFGHPAGPQPGQTKSDFIDAATGRFKMTFMPRVKTADGGWSGTRRHRAQGPTDPAPAPEPAPAPAPPATKTVAQEPPTAQATDPGASKYEKLLALSQLITDRGIPSQYTAKLAEQLSGPTAGWTVEQILEMDPDRQMESLRAVLDQTGTPVGDDWPGATPTPPPPTGPTPPTTGPTPPTTGPTPPTTGTTPPTTGPTPPTGGTTDPPPEPLPPIYEPPGTEVTGTPITGVSESIPGHTTDPVTGEVSITPFQPINQDPINGVDPIARDPNLTPGFSDPGTGVVGPNVATTGTTIDPTTGETGEGLTTTVTPFTSPLPTLALGQPPSAAPPPTAPTPPVTVTPGAPSPGPGGPEGPDPPGEYQPPPGEPNGAFGPGGPLRKPSADPGSAYMSATPAQRTEIERRAQDAWKAQNQNKRPGSFSQDPPEDFYEHISRQVMSEQGTTPPGGAGGTSPPGNQMFQLPPAAQAAGQQLLDSLVGETDPDKINAALQSYMGLQNLGQQDFFNRQFAPTAGAVAGLYNTAADRAAQAYELPNVPDLDSAQVYEEGAAGAGQMQHIIDQLSRTQAPLDNLGKLAEQTAKYMEGRSGDLVNPYRADLDEDFAQAERELEESLAARGMLGSTQADEARRRLREGKARAQADADLKFYQGVGGERRADIELTGGLLGDLFGQQMEGSEFALDRLGAQTGAVGQAEGMDLSRRGVEAQQAQTQFDNMMNSFLQRENVDANRLQMSQQPLAMLLSALSGTNVSPSVLGQLQMPQRGGPGFMGTLGNIAGNVASSWLSPGGMFGGGNRRSSGPR